MRISRTLAALATVFTVAGCASSVTHHASAPPPSPAIPPTTSAPAHHHHRHHHRRHHHALAVPAPPPACGTNLWRHVYHPDRLKIYQRCKTVHGTVTELTWEADGDLHIRLATRPSLVNAANDQYEHGDLVLEEICQGAITQADALGPCRGTPHNLAIPAVGDQVTVTGPYVLDQDHGWMEIHPVTSLAVTGPAAPPPPASAAPAPPPPSSAAPAPVSCHPTTSSGNCYEPGEFCPTADAGMTGVAGDGHSITCVLESGRYHWH